MWIRTILTISVRFVGMRGDVLVEVLVVLEVDAVGFGRGLAGCLPLEFLGPCVLKKKKEGGEEIKIGS